MTEFNSEAKDIEFRRASARDPYGLRVRLYGGPYAGRYGMVAIDQVSAWVSEWPADVAYERQLDGTWEWNV